MECGDLSPLFFSQSGKAGHLMLKLDILLSFANTPA
jgi:hypothetical protein